MLRVWVLCCLSACDEHHRNKLGFVGSERLLKSKVRFTTVAKCLCGKQGGRDGGATMTCCCNPNSHLPGLSNPSEWPWPHLAQAFLCHRSQSTLWLCLRACEEPFLHVTCGAKYKEGAETLPHAPCFSHAQCCVSRVLSCLKPCFTSCPLCKHHVPNERVKNATNTTNHPWDLWHHLLRSHLPSVFGWVRWDFSDSA